MVSWILILVGGLNLGLIGLSGLLGTGDWNVIGMLGSQIESLVYVLVGASAVYEIVSHKKNCKQCGSGGM
ncbi:MAG: hypothetical protein Q7S50_04500 [bacterium]|nr:hypothetical protein [bacterium]